MILIIVILFWLTAFGAWACALHLLRTGLDKAAPNVSYLINCLIISAVCAACEMIMFFFFLGGR